ncbi:hypothetical protein KY290_034075 [Solanum tuberosum]|uniref:PB1 domain-containing protein n=1 Tax=Solanum tuberosum TaxID=4113 RepID=A0ABQ7U462_SOLTU|nr:hypothetical protein KY289_033464 [Solanum tuberosum]KAH0741032.1 hypothetical protein KY290_034075 [Solanum tuberosum]
MTYFELKDYIRELGYSTTCTFSIKVPNSDILVDVDNDKDILNMMCSLEDGDELEVFVRHLIDEAIVGPILIENGSHVDMGESGSAFNTRPSESENFNFGVDGATADNANDDDIDVGPAGPDFSEEEKTPSAPSEGEPPLKKGIGRQKKTSSVAPSAPSLPTDFPASSSAPPTYHASSSIAGTTKRGRGRGRGNTYPKKRPRVMGMGVFEAANGFKVMNPSMPSSKIYSTGQAKVTRSSYVTSEIGYTPSNTTKLKWNGKATISTSKLHELKEKQRKKTMGSSSSQNDTSSPSKIPWKL